MEILDAPTSPRGCIRRPWPPLPIMRLPLRASTASSTNARSSNSENTMKKRPVWRVATQRHLITRFHEATKIITRTCFSRVCFRQETRLHALAWSPLPMMSLPLRASVSSASTGSSSSRIIRAYNALHGRVRSVYEGWRESACAPPTKRKRESMPRECIQREKRISEV